MSDAARAAAVRRSRGAELALEVALAGFGAALGIVAIVLPVVAILSVERREAPRFPLVATGIEEASVGTIMLLALAGALLGWIGPGRAWLRGVAMMSPLPLLALLEIRADPYSHTLFPIECVVYMLGTLPAIAGARWGARLADRPRMEPDGTASRGA